MSKTELQKVLPPETEVSRPFWEGCKAGELRMQHCSSCDRFQFYPRIVCSDCGGKELEWLPVSGLGVIASFTVVRRGISLAYDAPYVVVLIDLAEGVRMMSSECWNRPRVRRTGMEQGICTIHGITSGNW